ncbi:mitogen-activated protein kinase kinase 1 interacting domain-containing protein [Ditylenchus destructor]|uniref:Mitogen-activated protein kinase kinase 1 interacting domain-containing protein n=1 Tax=Ditylenchus destructor TaxID=166010 RepID=A0AAD4NBK4_9BILA|nr:mitogen-activated protein kinase kinase 1 interacting domain-containing protein [Ditylenchus destructor]
MTVKIVESLEKIIRTIPDIQSILILDRDGVSVVSAGDEIRNKGMLSSCFTSSIEQARKLGMGGQRFWTFQYESHQLVLLNLEPFAVFISATPSANTGILCCLGAQLKPILDECEEIVKEVSVIQ